MSSPSTVQLLGRLWAQISARRKRQLALTLGLMIVSAFAEMLSLGAVLPFLAALTAPQRVLAYPTIGRIAHAAGIDSTDALVKFFTIAFVASALVAGAIRMLVLWVSTRLAFATGADLSGEVYRRTLYQPYAVHVRSNSSELVATISKKTEGVSFGILLPALTLVSSVIILVAVVVALLLLDPAVALASALAFGAAYGLVTYLSQRELRLNSQHISREQTRVVQSIQEGLGGIRDVLLDGSQEFYSDVFGRANRPLWRAQHVNGFISASPKFAMEAFGVALIAALAYGLSRSTESVALALPRLGVLALGAQRLLPALQQSFASWTSIVGLHGSLADVLELIERPIPEESLAPAPPALQLRREIEFEGVGFRYSADGPWVLRGVDLTIPKGSRVGFIGRTGGGKSTVLDLLMALLDPTEGRLLVDGERVTGERKRAWQKAVAHVPQHIYLADATLAENIALGVPPEAIDFDRVRRAARLAQIEDLLDAHDAQLRSVGERGIRLSGGQRQRVGIARALYKDATILIFDEATSALDSSTEQAVVDGIASFDREITMVIVAHRLTSVAHCDVVVELEGGRLLDKAGRAG